MANTDLVGYMSCTSKTFNVKTVDTRQANNTIITLSQVKEKQKPADAKVSFWKRYLVQLLPLWRENDSAIHSTEAFCTVEWQEIASAFQICTFEW